MSSDIFSEIERLLNQNDWFVTKGEYLPNRPSSISAIRKEGERIIFGFNESKITDLLYYGTDMRKDFKVENPDKDFIFNLITNYDETQRNIAKENTSNLYRAERAYIEILKSLQKLSTCSRLKVAALLVRDGRIVATGWNGVASGQTHCEDVFKDYTGKDFYEKHHEFSIRYELHAEQNLISFCAKNGIETNNTTIYLTHSPCIHCAKILLSAGVKEVKFLELYDRDKSGVLLLAENNTPCYVLQENNWETINNEMG